MLGAAVVTVKFIPLLATPPTVTTTFPVVAPLGTGTTMLVAPQLVGVPAVPLNVTVLVPCVSPKFVAAIVTNVATGPDVSLKPARIGASPGVVPLPRPPAQPCSSADITKKRETVIRSFWKVDLLQSVIGKRLQAVNHCSRERQKTTNPIEQTYRA